MLLFSIPTFFLLHDFDYIFSAIIFMLILPKYIFLFPKFLSIICNSKLFYVAVSNKNVPGNLAFRKPSLELIFLSCNMLMPANMPSRNFWQMCKASTIKTVAMAWFSWMIRRRVDLLHIL